MHAIHTDETVAPQKLSYDVMERRLARERKARESAEALLESKSLELYQANLQAEHERALMGAVFAARPAGLIITDGALLINRLNPSASALLGLQPDALAGSSLPDFLSGDEETRAWINDRSGDSAAFDDSTVDGTLKQVSGDEIPVRISCSSIGLGDLRLWILIDIRRHLANEAEKQSLEQSLHQAQKLEALGTLASGVAHEINTPIQYVGDNVKFFQELHEGFSDLLEAYESLREEAEKQGVLKDHTEAVAEKREETDIEYLLEETPDALTQSLHGLDQVASIVAAIREFSHPGVSESTPVDVNSVIETTLSVSRNKWKNIAEVDKQFEADLPEIMGHPGDLHQVILNLVGNATDAIEEMAMPDGGTIQIKTRKLRDMVEISVGDNGKGIDKADCNRVFDPFFTTKPPGKGTGQGLAIVYKIVHVKHGGKITVASTPGKGTTFKLLLPVGNNTKLS